MTKPTATTAAAAHASAFPARWLDDWLREHEQSLVRTRRDLHQHPELGFAEVRTTSLIVERLRALGLEPRVLPGGAGVLCDIGDPASEGADTGTPGEPVDPTAGPIVALRADIDALPLPDPKDVPYRSQTPDVCHACGHDAHTAILLGVAEALSAAPSLPRGTVRLVFQPAEELASGGAPVVVAAGGLAGVSRIFALHCDPRVLTGQVGLRVGPITAACDRLEVRLSGPGGHTARPQLTVDLVYAMGRVITELPGLLSRRVDPRAGLSMVWGAAEAGKASNAIPEHGLLRGTVRVLDRSAWIDSERLVRELVEGIVAPTGAHADIAYHQGVPPVVNDPDAVAIQRAAALSGIGPHAPVQTEQSMGGEDFAWYLEEVPGALARLGVRPPEETGRMLDLHQGTFDIDERALAVGVRLMVHTALHGLLHPTAPPVG
jgi:amidohydrolase